MLCHKNIIIIVIYPPIKKELSDRAIFLGYYLYQQEKGANYTLMCTIHDKLWSFFSLSCSFQKILYIAFQ